MIGESGEDGGSGSSVPAPPRARAQDFLEIVEQSQRGRLKVYLGFAAGVGKTYRMLQEAHALKGRGVDVVVGFVEPHQRIETLALVQGLEVIPRLRIEYRGVTVEEMDLEATIARKPLVALVDEIAHTNTPGLKHRKRYLDVYELLDHGINVICAFNVQHLESLNDLVKRETGVVVRETVPDSFLKRSDQVVTLDLSVEDLHDRLKAGKIYAPEKIDWALQHFFQEKNLATLRELVLREVAESVERTSTLPASEGHGRAPGVGRVLVCIASHSPRAPELLRRGSRMAGRLNTNWYVVYVETPDEAPHLIDAMAQRILSSNIEIARELGAEVVRLKGRDLVQTVLDFARSHNVSHILLGRSHRPRWRRIFGLDVIQRFIDEGLEFDIQISAMAETTPP